MPNIQKEVINCLDHVQRKLEHLWLELSKADTYQCEATLADQGIWCPIEVYKPLGILPRSSMRTTCRFLDGTNRTRQDGYVYAQCSRPCYVVPRTCYTGPPASAAPDQDLRSNFESPKCSNKFVNQYLLFKLSSKSIRR